MSRPDDRPLRRLPALQARKDILERCVFCPKLCRSACPVGMAGARETVTPWGKMSMAYFVANESVELAASFASPAWACTGCFACRQSCDHQSDVAGTLFEARSALVEAGVAPDAATRTIAGFGERAAELRRATKELSSLPEVDEQAPTALLVGCAYAKNAPEEARDAIRAVAELVRGKVSLVDVCCGAPLLYAGDKEGFRRQGERLAQIVRHKEQLVVVDAGCASSILVHHAEAGVGMIAPVVHFSELAARELGRLSIVEGLFGDGPVRYHDPCQLGRGLGLYEPPRAVLGRALGRAPDEFERNREGATCSGAGGLLPLTMPDVSAAVTGFRLFGHASSGGGTIVTACASSLRAFREQGAKAVDLVTVAMRALGLQR